MCDFAILETTTGFTTKDAPADLDDDVEVPDDQGGSPIRHGSWEEAVWRSLRNLKNTSEDD